VPARNKNSSGRRSWRETPAQMASAPAASQWPLRVLLALVLILLVGCFAWLLSRPARSEPQTYFVALTTGRSDLFSVPPILFEQETLARLRDLSNSHNDFRFIDGEKSQLSASTSSIQSLLDSLHVNKGDRLILYVSAHGVSDDGVAYVLGPGYDLHKTREQRYPVNELLAVVARNQAATKLVAFDCSRLAVLPRMGMVLNEFSALVQQAASECDDENLWVAIAAPELETSPLGLVQQRSVFGSALVEGIKGGADSSNAGGNADRNVTLSELEDFMRRQCANASVATPAPHFFYCGSKQTSSRRKSPVFLRIYPEDDTEDEPFSESSLADTQETSPNPKSNESEPATAKDSTEKTPGKKSNDDSPIHQVWQLRDQLQQGLQAKNLKPLPVDFAPHYWNALNSALVDLHLRQIGHARPDEVSENIAEYQHGLQQLLDPTHTGNSNRVTEEIVGALKRYQSSNAWNQLSNLPRDYAQAILFVRRSMMRANQYVDWHRTAHASVGDAGSALSDTTSEISQLLINLSNMDQYLAKLERQSQFPQQQMKSLLARQTDIHRQFSRLDRIIAAPTASKQKQHTPDVQRQLENLLATSLANADQKAVALSSAPIEIKNRSEHSQPRRITALRHLRLECLLVQLAEPEAQRSSEFQAIVENRQRLPEDDQEMRQLFRKVGKEIKEFYAQIPSRAEKSSRARTQLLNTRSLEKMIAILHPRDATDRSNNSMQVAGFVVPRLQPPARVALHNPPETTLRKGRWISIDWPLQLENVKVQSAQITIGHFNQNMLDIRIAGTQNSVRPGQKKELSLKTLHEVALEVRLREEIPNQSTRKLSLPLTIWLQTNEKEYHLPGEAELTLPRPNRIDLIAWCVEPNILQLSRGDAGTRLQPFPNRTTAFRFALANHSDDEKKVRFELFAVPQHRNDAWPPGLLLDKNDQPLPALLKKKLFASPLAVAVVKLPADGKPYPAPLKKPGTSDDESSAESSAESSDGESDTAKGGSDQESNSEKPPIAREINNGLVCRIVDLTGDNEDLVKWIEISTLRPTSYLDVEATYNEASHKLSFEASLLDLDGNPGLDMPPQSAKKPVIMNFFGDDQILEGGRKGKAIIHWAGPKKRISVTLKRKISGSHFIGLVVDGYPRSHQWKIDFETGEIRKTSNHTGVEIDWIGMPGVGDEETGIAPRLYRTRSRLAFQPVNKKVWPVFIWEKRNHTCAFDISREARQLKLRLRVDAPRDAFNSADGKDVFVIGWKGRGWKERNQQPLHQFYSDRAVSLSLAEITKQGDLAIATKVDDLEVSLDAALTINASRDLQAQLRLRGREAAIDSRTIVFDDKSPAIISAELEKRKILIGTTKLVRAKLTIKDLSGVQKVEAWVFPKLPAGEEELDPKVAQEFSYPPGTDNKQLHHLSPGITVPEKLGKYFLVMRVTDRSGQKATTLKTPMRFAVVAQPPPPKPGPVIHDLIGVVKLGSRPAPAGLKVFAKENPKLSTTTKSSGKFRIKRVKAGSYTLLVKGLVGSGQATGELEVELAEKADYAVEILAEYEIAGAPE